MADFEVTDFSLPKKKKKKSKIPLAGTQGRGGVTPLEVQRQISAEGGPRTAWPTPGAAPAIEQPQPVRGPKTGVEGYVPQRGTVASLPPDVLRSIEEVTQGPIDNTLKNLSLAHYEMFNSWPDYTLTADILSNGEVEFETIEEARQFFQMISKSYEASGQTWRLDASLDIFGGAQERKNAGFSEETDILDPEMLASFRPEKVEDFLLGPYMKRTVGGTTQRFRDDALRLDEMLVALPRQWAISNLSNRLSARSKRLNPDRDQDEALMEELNGFLAARVPEDIAPQPTARWQNETEQALKYMQMMRAGSLYVASQGQDPEAAAFLETQGFSDIVNTLDEQIRIKADPTGVADEAKRAWVQEWYVQSRNPGITEGQAIHELAKLDLNMVTVEGQKQIGTDHLRGYAGAISGFFGSIPILNQTDDAIAKVVRSDEFQAATGWALPLASAVGTVLKPTIMVPLEAFGWAYEEWDKYRDTLLVSLRASEDSVLATSTKTAFAGASGALAGAAIGSVVPGVGTVIGGIAGAALTLLGPSALLTEKDEHGDFGSVLGEFFTTVYHATDGDVEWVGDFAENWTESMKRREAAREGTGVQWDYTDVVLRDLGMSPETHPEVAFLTEFAFDTFVDYAAAKPIGLAARAFTTTHTFDLMRATSGTALHQHTVAQTGVRLVKDAVLEGEVAAEVAAKTGRVPRAGRSFTSKYSHTFGVHPADAETYYKLVREGIEHGLDDTDLTRLSREIISREFRKSGRKNLDADSWGLHYRVREKAMFNPESFFYSGNHPHLSKMMERLYSGMNFSAADDAVPDGMRELGFQVRTGLDTEDVPWVKDQLRQKAGAMHDDELLAEIDSVNDVVGLSHLVEGLYANSDEWARTLMQNRWRSDHGHALDRALATGNEDEVARVTAETFEESRHADVESLTSVRVSRRIEMAADLDHWKGYRFLTREAPNAGFRRRFRKSKHFAEWHEAARELAEREGREIADDFVPMGAMYRRFSDSMTPREMRHSEVGRAARPDAGETDAVGRLAEDTNYPAYMPEPGKPVSDGVINEVSGAIDYNAREPWRYALHDHAEEVRGRMREAHLATPEDLERLTGAMADLESVKQKLGRLAHDAIAKHVKGKATLEDKLRVIGNLEKEIKERSEVLSRMRPTKRERKNPKGFEQRKAAAQREIIAKQEQRAAVQIEVAKEKTAEAVRLTDQLEDVTRQIDEAVAEGKTADLDIAGLTAESRRITEQITANLAGDTDWVERIAPLMDNVESRARVSFELAQQEEKSAKAIVDYVRGLNQEPTAVQLATLEEASEQAALTRAAWQQAAHRKAVAEIYHRNYAASGARPFVDPLTGTVSWRFGANARPRTTIIPYEGEAAADMVTGVQGVLDEPALRLPDELIDRITNPQYDPRTGLTTILADSDPAEVHRLIAEYFEDLIFLGRWAPPPATEVRAATAVTTRKLAPEAAAEAPAALPRATRPLARPEGKSGVLLDPEFYAPRTTAAKAEGEKIVDLIEEYNEALVQLVRSQEFLQRRINAAYKAKDQRSLNALWPQIKATERSIARNHAVRAEFEQRLASGQTHFRYADDVPVPSAEAVPPRGVTPLSAEEIEAQAGRLSERTGEFIGKKGKTRERAVKEREDLEPDELMGDEAGVVEVAEEAVEEVAEEPTLFGVSAPEMETAMAGETTAGSIEELMGAAQVYDPGTAAYVAEIIPDVYTPPNQAAIDALVRICAQSWRNDGLTIHVMPPRPIITRGKPMGQVKQTFSHAYWSGDSWSKFDVGVGPGMIVSGPVKTFDLKQLTADALKATTPREGLDVLKKHGVVPKQGALASMPEKIIKETRDWDEAEILEVVETLREAFAKAGLRQKGEEHIGAYIEAMLGPERGAAAGEQMLTASVAKVLGEIVDRLVDGYPPIMVDLPESMARRRALRTAAKPAVVVNPARRLATNFGEHPVGSVVIGRPSRNYTSDYPVLSNPFVPLTKTGKISKNPAVIKKAVDQYEVLWDEIMSGAKGSFTIRGAGHSYTYSYDEARRALDHLAERVRRGEVTSLTCPTKTPHYCHNEVLKQKLIERLRGLGPPEEAAAPAAATAATPTGTTQLVRGGDIFDGSGIPIITTNLGGVHGAGVAKVAADRGLVTKGKGAFSDSTQKAVVFPVKKTWKENADLDLIQDSLNKLGRLADAHPDQTFLMPPIGLGHGGRTVEEIAPLLRDFLPKHPNVKLVLPSKKAATASPTAKSMQGKMTSSEGLEEAVFGPPAAAAAASTVAPLKVYSSEPGVGGLLSNFAASPIKVGTRTFPTVEHAYQTAKIQTILGSKAAKEFAEKTAKMSPAKVKQEAGRILKGGGSEANRKKWQAQHLDIMRRLLQEKFKDPALRQALLDTGERPLEHIGRYTDTYWGAGKGGANWHGKLLMDERARLLGEDLLRETGVPPAAATPAPAVTDDLAEQVAAHGGDEAESLVDDLETPPESRVMEADEAAAYSASEVRQMASPPMNDELRELQRQMRNARQSKRRAERKAAELEQDKLKLKAEYRKVDAELRALRSQYAEGSAEALTPEQIKIVADIIDSLKLPLGGEGTLDEFVAADPELAMATIKAELESAHDQMWMYTFQPEDALHWVPQPSREWQLQTYYRFRFSPSRVAKFNGGPVVRAMETAWSRKWFLGHSVDDFTTWYKTLVMMKVSTMLRIPLADEFVRIFTEGMNPLEALKDAETLRAIDKLPHDIQFRLSELIRHAVDGPIVAITPEHPKAFTAYLHLLSRDRRDPTYARYILGHELQRQRPGEMLREVKAFVENNAEHPNLQSFVNDYLKMYERTVAAKAPEEKYLFAAWYLMGYEKNGGLRRLGVDSHRILRLGPDEGDVTMQSHFTAEQAEAAAAQSRSGAQTPIDQYSRKDFGNAPTGQYADARNLVENLIRYYDWWNDHRFLGQDWRLADRTIGGKTVTGLTHDEIEAMRSVDNLMELPADLHFQTETTRLTGAVSKKNWEDMVKQINEPELTPDQRAALVPGLTTIEDGTYMGGIPQIRKVRDTFYSILDYAGSRMNEAVYASAFQTEKRLLLKEGRSVADAEARAAHHAREYVQRVMYHNATYMGEDLLRNLLLFLPAYRQFVQYWVPYLAKHPYMASVAYRANRDKEQFEDIGGPGAMSFDLSRMTFLINQGDGALTGWLPGGGPLISMPISAVLTYKKGSENSIWGDLAGHWPFEFAGSYLPINSPLDKVMYGLFGMTLPWPFGSDPERNPWRELQLVRAAALKGQTLGEEEAHSLNQMRRLKEGLWNFFVPVGMRFRDEDVETMLAANRDYNASTTPEEMEAILSKPENKKFATFQEWLNLPSYEQLAFLKEHPEIVPYMVSGFSGSANNDTKTALIWSKLRSMGVADPALYGRRLEAKYDMIEKIIQASEARDKMKAEEEWWEKYAAEHYDDHGFYRMKNEWETSSGTFAPGGVQYQQGHYGKVALQEQLNTRFIGISDPFTGITSTDSDAYRLASILDQSGGAAKKLLQLSPNYEMYMLLKLQEGVEQTNAMVKNYAERRMATRLTPEEISAAGYNEVQTEKITKAVREIDRIWDSADKAVDRYGKYGYATTEGRAIRKAAIIAQNKIIHSSPLLNGFLGDNVVALFGKTSLTKPVWERADFVKLDQMDEVERDMFYHLTSEKDPLTGKPRWNGVYLPEKEKRQLEDASFLGYVPDGKGGWLTKVQIGDVVGIVKGKVPKEAKQIELTWRRAQEVFDTAFGARVPTVAEMEEWRRDLKVLPPWARALVEEGLRAQAWTSYLRSAAHARKELRETPNPYYSDAPGFSVQSKFGAAWKKSMNDYGKLLGRYSPAFRKEYQQYNHDNELINAILGWYL